MGVSRKSRTLIPLKWLSSNAIAAGQTRYLPSVNIVGHEQTILAVEDHQYGSYYCTRAGILKNLIAFVGTAPGAGETYIYTVRVNAANSAMTCTISDADLRASDITHSLFLNVGDRITISVVASGGAAGSVLGAIVGLVCQEN